jgi:hypothetical protein
MKSRFQIRATMATKAKHCQLVESFSTIWLLTRRMDLFELRKIVLERLPR